MSSEDWKSTAEDVFKKVRTWLVGQSDYRIVGMLFGTGVGFALDRPVTGLVVGYFCAYLYEILQDRWKK